MPKINNTDIYGFDLLPTPMDFLIGSDEENFRKTRSYRLAAIIELINNINGQAPLQFMYTDESNPEFDINSNGAMATEPNESDPTDFEKIYFNKNTINGYNVGALLLFLGEFVENGLVISLRNPADPNFVMDLLVTDFSDEDTFVNFFVEPYLNFYSGGLINETIYALSFDLKEGFGQDNIFRSIKARIDSDKLTMTLVLAALNTLPQYEITQIENVMYNILWTDENNQQLSYKFILINRGKGIYGTGGIQLTAAELELVYAGAVSTEDFLGFDTTQFIELGDIGSDNISDYINSYPGSLDVQDQEDGYVIFSAIINDEELTYLFLGEGGSYGFGLDQTTIADFQLLNGSGLTQELYIKLTGTDVGAPVTGNIIVSPNFTLGMQPDPINTPDFYSAFIRFLNTDDLEAFPLLILGVDDGLGGGNLFLALHVAALSTSAGNFTSITAEESPDPGLHVSDNVADRGIQGDMYYGSKQPNDFAQLQDVIDAVTGITGLTDSGIVTVTDNGDGTWNVHVSMPTLSNVVGAGNTTSGPIIVTDGTNTATIFSNNILAQNTSGQYTQLLPTSVTISTNSGNKGLMYKNDSMTQSYTVQAPNFPSPGTYYQVFSASELTAAEVSYLAGVTSSIQTQINAKQDALTAANFGSFTNGLTAKTTPVDADQVLFMDSAASNVAKKVSWANVKATLKTYFDTLYQAVLSASVFGTFHNGLSAETSIDDADYDLFYDTSATAEKKITFANKKATLKTYFDGLYPNKKSYMRLSSDYTAAGTTSLQKIFNVGSSGNGSFAVVSGNFYEFELCLVTDVLAGGATTISFGILGTATFSNINLIQLGAKNTLTSPSTAQVTHIDVATGVVISSSSSTGAKIIIRGTVAVSGSGTLIPAASFSSTPTSGGFKAGSICFLRLVGTTSETASSDVV